MKKLLYLIPVLLIGLSILGISLHNDTVSNDPATGLQGLRPNHWKLHDYELNASVELSNSAASNDKQFKAYSDGAKFYGFPFGFYFSKNDKTSISTLKVSAYSWLWIAVDLLILIISLLFAVYFNRSHGQTAHAGYDSKPSVPDSPASPTPTYPAPSSPPDNIYPS